MWAGWSKNTMYYSYALTAANEGYNNGDASQGDQWPPGGDVGACWQDDDSGLGPGHPYQPGHSRREGTDCSGLVAKVWGLRDDYTTISDQVLWDRSNAYRAGNRFYTGAMFGSGVATDIGPWKFRTWTDRTFMDAGGYNNGSGGHIVIIVVKSTSGTSDQTFEASGHTNGTGYFPTRNVSTYSARYRTIWGGA